jgi:hypothetical protein
MRPSCAVIVRCVGRVADSTTAAGVVRRFPAAISAAAASPRRSTPIIKTTVSARASAFQSSRDPALPGASCAVATATDAAQSRCVTGMPAAAGPAKADVTPGTISNGILALESASASSPPRPNTNGSPPLRRTTLRPARARRRSSVLISPCVIAWRRALLPAKIRSAPSGANASSSGETSRS